MLSNFVKIICLYLSFLLLRNVLKIKPKESVEKLIYSSVQLLGDFNYNVAVYNERKRNTSKGKTFRSGKYYNVVEKMLSDLEVNSLTVEAFTSMLVIFTLIVNIIIFSITGSVTLFILFSVAVFTLSLTLLFMISIQNSNSNTFAILDAVDLIISTVKKGFVNSVRLNLEGIPKKVRPHFEEFLEAIDDYQTTYEDALDQLRSRLGPVFDDTYRIARPYEKHAYAGAEQEFQDIININTNLRMSMLKLSKKMRSITSGFAGCIVMIVVTALFMLGPLDGVLEAAFTTFKGQMILGINVIALTVGFAFIQFNSQGLKTRR